MEGSETTLLRHTSPEKNILTALVYLCYKHYKTFCFESLKFFFSPFLKERLAVISVFNRKLKSMLGILDCENCLHVLELDKKTFTNRLQERDIISAANTAR